MGFTLLAILTALDPTPCGNQLQIFFECTIALVTTFNSVAIDTYRITNSLDLQTISHPLTPAPFLAVEHSCVDTRAPSSVMTQQPTSSCHVTKSVERCCHVVTNAETNVAIHVALATKRHRDFWMAADIQYWRLVLQKQSLATDSRPTAPCTVESTLRLLLVTNYPKFKIVVPNAMKSYHVAIAAKQNAALAARRKPTLNVSRRAQRRFHAATNACRHATKVRLARPASNQRSPSASTRNLDAPAQRRPNPA